MTFESWLTDLLQQGESEVRSLLGDQSAFRFLIVWSLFEAKCFSGFMRIEDLDKFARRLVAEGYDVGKVTTAISSFHARYQDERLYSNLMHQQSVPRLERLLKMSVEDMSQEDVLFLSSVVIYRYRNNMFHGNKGVRSWLQFRDQIAACTELMQTFITHAESVSPTLPERQAA